MKLQHAVNLAGVGARAGEVLSADVRAVTGGSGAEPTPSADRAAPDRLRAVPRALADVSTPDTSARPIGTAVPAPMAYQRLVHPDGEPAAARAANLPDGASTAAERGSTWSAVAAHTAEVTDPSPSRPDVAWLRERTRLAPGVRTGC